MSFQYKAGLNNVGNYQVSGIPYVTGGFTIPSGSSQPLEIIFPSVTQRIHIHNNDTTHGVRVGFSANGVKGTNYWLIEPHTTSGKNNDYMELRVKTDRIFLISNSNSNTTTGSFIAAELSGIKLDFNLAEAYSGSQDNNYNPGIG